MAGELLERPKVQRAVSTVSQGPARPKVQRGVSTVSGAPVRPPVQRGVSTVSKVSAKSGSPEVKPVEKPKVSLSRRVLNFSSHFVLIIMLAIYSAAGGWAFVHFEKQHEIDTNIKHKQIVNHSKEYLVQRVWNYSRSNLLNVTLNSTEKQKDLENTMKNLLVDLLKGYDKTLYAAADAGVNVTLHYDSDINWDSEYLNWHYPSSMFFSTTVITTIGYGNIAPETNGGRVFCVIYALFGIPLTLIAVGDMGKMFASLLTFFYKKIKKRVKARAEARRAVLEEQEKLNKKDAAKTTQTTTIAPPAAATDATSPPDASTTMTSVKVLGAIFLLLLYIALGGGLFILWEDWSFFESFYFCFITMTTIGLGDVVPEHPMFMLLCTVYILIGLAITSTCIELARSEYEKSWQRMVEASKRIQTLSTLSLADTLKRIGDQIELHGEVVDLSLIRELKCAIVGVISPGEEQKPPPIIVYETSV